MPGVDLDIAIHRLHVDPSFRPIKKKKKTSQVKRIALYKRRLVDGSAGYEVFDFLYELHDDGQEKTTFISEYELYCWRVMLFELSIIISRSGDHSFPFFKNIRQASKKPFEWDEECTRAFLELKEYLGSPQLLTRTEEGEDLQLYLAVSEGAVSSVLVREDEGTQKPIYYVSHVLHGPEESYPLIEKFVLAVVTTSRKLKAYFKAHPIKVLTDQPIKRGQALADFVVEYIARVPEVVQGPRDVEAHEVPPWTLYVDGASNEKGQEQES
ncbi:hypothetical protein LIER_05538 [Lithospermum erythrorhizon]|uniref:Reverse transcriptase/retrotransposon-derived protein RNase H-like domain-containing protein n=1 Tax=Lithospermum erythrorhizon TaxID=34254 RepID=A0AAV3P5S9_LITER